MAGRLWITGGPNARLGGVCGSEGPARGLCLGFPHAQCPHDRPPQVCAEESLWEILRRYLPNNAHAGSYTWKHAGAVLDMERTLEQNGLTDDDEELWHLGLDPSLHAPGLLLHFNDDLTEL